MTQGVYNDGEMLNRVQHDGEALDAESSSA